MQTPALPRVQPETGDVTAPPIDLDFDVEETPVLVSTPTDYSGDDTGSGPVVPLSPPITQLQVAKTLTPPMYPPASIRRNEQGTVRLLLYVLPNGRVSQVKIDRSSGFPLLDKAAATAAMRDWTFKPATQGGTPIAAWGTYAVTFTLRD